MVLQFLAQNNNYCCCCYIYKCMKEDSLTGIFLSLTPKVSSLIKILQWPPVSFEVKVPTLTYQTLLDLATPHLYSSDLISCQPSSTPAAIGLLIVPGRCCVHSHFLSPLAVPLAEIFFPQSHVSLFSHLSLVSFLITDY